ILRHVGDWKMAQGKRSKFGREEETASLLYAQLYEFNQHCVDALIALSQCKPAIHKSDEEYCRSLIQEARALASQSIAEWLSESELSAASSHSRRRIAIEKRMSK